MPELYELSALELVRRVHARDVSRREVLEAHLDRIDAIDPLVNAVVERVERWEPQLKALYAYDPEGARAEAQASTDRWAQGAPKGPLDGVPVSIKDHFDVEGMLHTEGIRWFADRRSSGNSAVVQRLLDAGALVVGKCNQPDFQIHWNTVNDLYGATRNPRDTRLTAGGSSGGSAARLST